MSLEKRTRSGYPRPVIEEPPFAAQDQLYHNLTISPEKGSILRIPKRSNSPETVSNKTYLPGQPRIGLEDPELPTYLHSEFVTPDLDRLGPHLWLVAKQDSTHISSLTEQAVRGRRVVITENPELHLVWAYDIVYLKPIPKYLLSHPFWEFYLTRQNPVVSNDTAREAIVRGARGFLRSYFYLIQHKSDFLTATNEGLCLLPHGIRYSQFMRFISAFEKVQDSDVSPRYHFGQLRLTRLNFWSKVFLQRLNFHKMYWQYGTLFANYYGPLLFVFGWFSVALSAMQVALAVEDTNSTASPWYIFATVSRVFSVVTLFVILLSIVFLIVVFTVHVVRELVYALGDLCKKSRVRA
ncbi:hypothetical protein AOCH_003658 [Aspergillus ochraceoroseus]|uniref:Uncharacterized protein n=2 Tax=Aspergillus ochraceoroseus TaxID=138278 RepID=A0A0F8X0H9_9EURO|nr:hypothetical protein AOCH_003658 [Aspergillus ochraceoroseus]